jgi:hypothetical protein
MRRTKRSIGPIASDIPQILNIGSLKRGNETEQLNARVLTQAQSNERVLTTQLSDEHFAPEVDELSKER